MTQKKGPGKKIEGTEKVPEIRVKERGCVIFHAQPLFLVL
jgi:hypothetical protein